MNLEEIKRYLEYDPNTGIFRWLRVTTNKISVGDIAGMDNGFGYIRIGFRGKRYLAHKLAWFYMTGEWPKSFIDHKDRNRSNNRWENLRMADKRQNAGNSKLYRTNTTGHRGLYWNKRNGNWNVSIHIDNTKTNLGTFADKEEAIAAYERAAIAHFGEEFAPKR